MTSPVPQRDMGRGTSLHWNVLRICGRILVAWIQFLRRTEPPDFERASLSLGRRWCFFTKDIPLVRECRDRTVFSPFLKASGGLSSCEEPFHLLVHSLVRPFIHSFIQHIFIQCVLRARHRAGLRTTGELNLVSALESLTVLEGCIWAPGTWDNRNCTCVYYLHIFAFL